MTTARQSDGARRPLNDQHAVMTIAATATPDGQLDAELQDACSRRRGSQEKSNRRSKRDSDDGSTRSSPISAGSCGSTRFIPSAGTIPAPVAIRRRTASATPSRSRSAFRTTTRSARIARGPRNQRRSPMVVNTAFLRKLMWNGRFSAPSGDPFDNSRRFLFPPPEGDVTFPPNDPIVKHLLAGAGAHSPDGARRGGGIHRNVPDARAGFLSVRRWAGRAGAGTGRLGIPQRADPPERCWSC